VFLLPLFVYGLFANRTHATQIRGRSVLVTGASSGLGRAFAIEAAQMGATKVILVARGLEGLQTTMSQINVAGSRAEVVVLKCDITDPEQVLLMCKSLLEEHGCPDLLVNNAGAGAWQHIEETSPEDALAHTACPYLGATYITHALAPAMIERRSGHVLNVTSAASLTGFRAAVTYGTARWAMRGFSQYLRADLDEVHIGVTLLNAAEVTGTGYFEDKPGKAGALSHQRIPWLFQTPLVQRFARDTRQTARAGLDAVQSGTHELMYPVELILPTALFGDLLPDALHYAMRFGKNGRR
jgi:NADP-dependent 3-hydroxy acid dehydrogenase YdfG